MAQNFLTGINIVGDALSISGNSVISSARHAAFVNLTTTGDNTLGNATGDSTTINGTLSILYGSGDNTTSGLYVYNSNGAAQIRMEGGSDEWLFNTNYAANKLEIKNKSGAGSTNTILTLNDDSNITFGKSADSNRDPFSIKHASNDFLYVLGGTAGVSINDDGEDTRMILFNSGNVRFDAGTLDNAFVITADTGAATFAGDITATQKKFIATSSSSGDYIRLYAASGTGKWDIYGNGANLRISDNDSAGILVVDTGASFGGTVTATLSGTATGLAGTPAISVGNITTTGYLRGPASFTIDPATHGDDTGTVVIAGNLQVDGTTTTINSTTVAIDDLNFSIATDAADSAAANGAGITIGGASATLLYTHATTSWDMNKHFNVTGGKVTIVPNSGAYDQLKIASNLTADTDKQAGIYTENKVGNNTSIIQYACNTGGNTVYYGSADGNYRGLTAHRFYVNASPTATSGHTQALLIAGNTHATFAGYIGTGGHTPDVGLEVYGTSNTAAKIKITNTATTPDNIWSIHAAYNAQDLIFTGDSQTVLTMHDSGNATFAGAVSLTGGALSISGDGSNAATLTETSAGILTIATVDDFIVDAEGDITFDANGGDIRLKDGGTQWASIYTGGGGTHMYIESAISDKDIIFKGNDGGSAITALTLDMSAGGNATFLKEITSGDDINTPTKIVVGEGATPELRLKKTDAGTATVSYYSANSQKGYIQLDASEDMVYYAASGVDNIFYAGGGLNLTLSGTTATFAGDVTVSGNLLSYGDGTNNNTFIQGRGNAGQYSGIKLARGAGNWSSTANNHFGMLVSDAGIELSKFTALGDNTTGRDIYMTIADGGGATFAGSIYMGNTVVNPASGFADQTGIGLKYSTTVPEIQVSSDSTAMQLGRTSTGGAGQILAMRAASTTVHNFQTTYYSTTGWVDAANYKIGGAQGSDGQVLTSTGSGVAWEAVNATFTGGTVANATTFSSDVTMTSSGAANSPTLAIDNPDSGTFNHGIEVFGANMTAGETQLIVIGKAGTDKNSGYIGYNWAGAGSDDNYLTFGHWGANHMLRLYGSGTATFAGDAIFGGTTIEDNNSLSRKIEIAAASPVGLILNDTRDTHPMAITNDGAVMNFRYNTTAMLSLAANSNATFAGNISHTGLTPTAGTDIDQIYTASVSLQVTTSWQDTTVNAAELATGTYIVQLYTDDHGTNSIGHYTEYYSGIMSWYSTNTNSTETDEIILHRAGHSPNVGDIFLRTERTASADTTDMNLQIKTSNNASGSATYVFKFRRMI